MMRLWPVLIAVAAIGLGAASGVPSPVASSGNPQGQPQAAAAISNGGQRMSAYERESLAADRAANRIGERANSIAEAQRVYGLLQIALSAFGVLFTGAAAFWAYRATHWAKKAAAAAAESARADNESLAENRTAARDARADALEQARRFKEQMDKTQEMVEFTAKTSYAMEHAASAMRKAASATEKQIAVFGRYADLTEKQHAVGRLQYFATNRPRLIVREVTFHDLEPTATLQFTIANVGASAAVIVESYADLAKRESGDLFGLEMPPGNQVGDITIPPGGHHTHRINSEVTALNVALAAGQIDEGFWKRLSERYVLRGYLVYEDQVAQIRRRTAFWRVYEGDTYRFRSIDDPDREYAD